MDASSKVDPIEAALYVVLITSVVFILYKFFLPQIRCRHLKGPRVNNKQILCTSISLSLTHLMHNSGHPIPWRDF